jgi:DNA (cytosine-5)-methyltransferase 1
MQFSVGGLFSGVGGIELAFKHAGFKLKWSNENDPAARATFKANFDHELYENDINELVKNDFQDIPPVDVLVGGFPCQAFSIAGYRKGFKDDRGNLFFRIVDFITKLEEAHGRKPTAIFLENVKNFRTHDKGRTFDRVLLELNNLGYHVFHGILNTKVFTKIPQNRARTFLVGFQEGPGETRFEDMPLDDTDLLNGKPISFRFNQEWKGFKEINSPSSIENFLVRNVDEKYFYHDEKYPFTQLNKFGVKKGSVYQWRRVYVRENREGICPTLTANMGTGGHNVPIIFDPNRKGRVKGSKIRKLTPRECFNLQGFPDENNPHGRQKFELPDAVSDAQKYKQAGNSVTVDLVESLARLIREALLECE